MTNFLFYTILICFVCGPTTVEETIMALVNGKRKEFTGLSFKGIGELIVEETGTTDGKGLTIQLMQWEEAVFVEHFGLAVGAALCELIVDAIEAKTGIKPNGLQYTHEQGRFTS